MTVKDSLTIRKRIPLINGYFHKDFASRVSFTVFSEYTTPHNPLASYGVTG